MRQTTTNPPEDFSIENIIKKYENRQAEVTHKLKHQKYCEDMGRELEEGAKAEVSTPHFSHTIDRKAMSKQMENQHIQRTHKKPQQPQGEVTHMSFSLSNERNDNEQLLKQLDQTEERLARSERNYAEVWRKYEKLLHERQTVSKEVELEQKIRVKEQGDLTEKVCSLQRELKGVRECLAAKEESVAVLKEKVGTEQRTRAELEGQLVEVRQEVQNLKARQATNKSEEEVKMGAQERALAGIEDELKHWKDICESLTREKAEMSQQLQRNYISHKDELDIIKQSYLKVEEEYKQWIEQCNQEKITLLEEYQRKLQAAQQAASQDHLKALNQQHTEDELIQREQEMGKLVAHTVKQTNEIKALKLEADRLEKKKFELVQKVSSLENSMIDRMEQYRALQTAHQKLKVVCKSEEEKTREVSAKYREMSGEFAELKSKCQVMFGELQTRKQQRQGQSDELARLRKELSASKMQLDNYRSGQLQMNNKLTQSLSVIKTRLCKVQEEKHEVNSDLLAERLENAKLRQELRETKQNLKREYELSLESTRREMLMQINSKRAVSSVCDQEKEQLYLQLRELERRYQLLANEIVTVDEVVGLANKVDKRRRAVPARK